MSELSIFEKIINREIPADIVLEDEEVLVFRDITPQAPTHLLAVPKRRINRLSETTAADESILGKLLLAAKTAAQDAGLNESGFRIVINNGPDGGESVPHLHVHVLGGRALQWPPG